MNKQVKFVDWGLVDYQEAWDRQETLFTRTVAVKNENRLNNTTHPTPNHLIFTEHPHVYTLGKSGHAEYLLLDDEGLNETKPPFYHINRGGGVAYHGRGQIVGCRILDLDSFCTDTPLYLRPLEEAIIRACSEYGIQAGRYEGFTGVWL